MRQVAAARATLEMRTHVSCNARLDKPNLTGVALQMDEMHGKIETWKKLIQSEKLRDVLEDIQV